MELNGLSGLSSANAANTYTSINKEENETKSFQKVLENASTKGDDKEIKKACQDFESYFLQMMYKAMRKTVDTSNSFVPKSQAEDMFQDMLDEESCKSASKTNAFGLSNSLYKQMMKERDGNLNRLDAHDKQATPQS